jgi:tetratricopeptide (TPR) repeat protein
MNWEEVKRLFHEALRDRRVLEGASGAVRAEVEALLRAHEAVPPEAAREGPGSVIGRFKLLQQIGEGGFGVVYMAEQTEPVRRKVALKVLKAGMDTGQVVARFEAERQALALMDHENIAKVLDAGSTSGGRPYFVMELVKGVPITEYCDEAQVDTRGRLELFTQVCHAVQHAHQKGIIHRDLKPSNVLVTLHDGEPVPKVIDFGIAKAIDQRLTERTLFTEFRQMIGTPEYMAPEQAELSGLDVDTRADVYSLGVLLYELLTGTKPFDLRAKAFDEMMRTIRETDAPRPSTRVSTMGDALLAVAGKRRTPPRQLGRLLKGDLDWIVMKALEKDRSRRYETANGLASDIRRHLADEPVLASPPGAGYQMRKYVRRHRVGVAVALVVVSGVVVSSGMAYAGMREAEVEAADARRAAEAEITRRDEAKAARAREQEQRDRARAGAAEARKETLRARTVSDLLDGMLGSADPHALKGRNYTVRQLLDDFDRTLGTTLKDEPDVEATVRHAMGDAYLGLGLGDRAEPHLRGAVEIRRRVLGDASDATVESRCACIYLLVQLGRFEEAEREAREAVETWRASGRPVWIARGLINLSMALLPLHRLDEALASLEEARALADALADGPEAIRLRRLARVYMGYVHDLGERYEEARRCFEEVLVLEPPGPKAVSLRMSLAGVCLCLGDLDRAEPLIEEALADGRRFLDASHPLITEALGRTAQVAYARGRLDRAQALAQECLGRMEEGFQDRGSALMLLGLIQLDRRDPAAEDTFRKVMDHERALGREDLPGYLMALSNLGLAHENRCDFAAAEECQSRALDGFRRCGVLDGVIRTLHGIGRTREVRGDLAGAEEVYREALEVVERLAEGESHQSRGPLLAEIAFVTEALGRPEEAESFYSRAREASVGQWIGLDGLCEWFLACRRMREGDLQGTEAHLRTALDLNRRSIGEEHGNTIEMRLSIAVVLCLKGEEAEAEPMLRELAAMGEAPRRVLAGRILKLEWLRCYAMSLLGDALAREGKYAEAEPLLVQGFEGMDPPDAHAVRKREALDRIVKLYEAWGKLELAAEWRRKG